MKASEKIKKLRKEYIVVARTFADDDEPSYSITKRENFSVMPYHDTFGPYGEVDYTCDYTIEENDDRGTYRSQKTATFRVSFCANLQGLSHR